MLILHSPDGMPHQIPEIDAATFLKQGFYDPQQVVGQPSSNSNEGTSLDTNTASLKELTSLPGVSMALARKIHEHRPYAVLEDLIAAVPEVEWLAMARRVKPA